MKDVRYHDRRGIDAVLKVNKDTIGSKPILYPILLSHVQGVLVVKPDARLTPVADGLLFLVFVSDDK